MQQVDAMFTIVPIDVALELVADIQPRMWARSRRAARPIYQTKVDHKKINLHNVSTDFRLILSMTGTAEITVGHSVSSTIFSIPSPKFLIRASGSHG